MGYPGAKGRKTVITVPRPSSESTVMRPRCFSMMPKLIESPRPVPCPHSFGGEKRVEDSALNLGTHPATIVFKLNSQLPLMQVRPNRQNPCRRSVRLFVLSLDRLTAINQEIHKNLIEFCGPTFNLWIKLVVTNKSNGCFVLMLNQP